MNKKEKLYYLIEHYMLGNYDTQTFSDQFSDIYCHDENDCEFTELEEKMFSEIDEIAGRVSCFREDLEKYPGVYFTECDIRRKTIEVCKKLDIKY